MRRGRILIFVVLILVIFVVVAFVALQQFLRGQGTQTPAFVQVYVAGQNIPQGGKITESVLSTISIPQENVVTVMYTTDELAQLTTNKIARFPLDQGVVITEAMVADESVAVAVEGPQWAALVPPGMTAISIPATRLSLSSYGVANGAHVNLTACLLFVDVDPSFQSMMPNNIATLTGTGVSKDGIPILSLSASPGEWNKPDHADHGRLELDPSLQQPFYLVPSEPQRPRPVCQLLLQDVVVLRVGDFPLSEQAPAAQGEAAPAPAAPDVVTLIVSPQDAITLTYLTFTNTQIQLSLRNPTDPSRQATEAATLQFLLSQYNIPIPAKLPYAQHPRLDSLVAPVLPNDVPAPAE
jgi:pilus assembly protein CpaB